MSETPVEQKVESIAVETFERLVYERRHNDALGALFGLLLSVKRNAGLSWYGGTPSIETIFTRICSAITALFADPQFAMSYDGFARLITDHATLHGLYKMSGFGSMDYALGLCGARHEADPTRLNFAGEFVVPKLLSCWSLDSDIELDFEEMAKQAPIWVAATMLGILAIGGIHSARGYARKVELAKKAHLIEGAPLHEMLMLAVGDCYMHCSYMDFPEKHDMKKILNRQLRKIVEAKMPEPIVERTTLEPKERPTIVVPVEWFGSHHAMYRCYAPSIRQLRKRFRVVAIARPSDIDDIGIAEFDKCVMLEGGNVAINKMVELVQAENPDILYYPSLGMAAWWVALSNFRLAPIQVMTPGHPATSHSPCMDYIVSDGDLFGDESNYSEKCVHLPVGGARYIGRAGLDIEKLRAVRAGKTDKVWRLAVPAMVMKLMPPFLVVLARIYQEAVARGLKVEVHFFPNQAATYNELIGKELRAWIPTAHVYPRMDYQPYLELLARCDLMLSTFPFGGTNSTIDCMLTGMPVVTLEGDQIHSRSDASMIRRVGLPEWLITHSVEEYVAAVLYYLSKYDARRGVKKAFERVDIEAVFYGDGPPEVHDAFLRAFERIYQEKIDEQERGLSACNGDERSGSGPDELQPGVAAGPVG